MTYVKLCDTLCFCHHLLFYFKSYIRNCTAALTHYMMMVVFRINELVSFFSFFKLNFLDDVERYEELECAVDTRKINLSFVCSNAFMNFLYGKRMSCYNIKNLLTLRRCSISFVS